LSERAGREGYESGEAARMVAVLRSCRWNVSKAARTMGIPRPTFYRKMKRYGVSRSKAD